jgi:hypothetical protein
MIHEIKEEINMSVLAFNIKDFTKKIEGAKFKIGSMYVLTLDPDETIDFTAGSGNNRINHRKCFIINADENGTRLRSNDSAVFSNPLKTREPIICEFIEQTYLDNCSLVYFNFAPEKMFARGDDSYIPEYAMCNCMSIDGCDHVVRYGAKCDDYIITDDIENVYDITASDAASDEDAKFNADDINDVKFVSVDDNGNKTELDPEIIKIISTCAKIGVIDKDGNFKSMFENDIDNATKQKIQAEFSKLNKDETKTA